MSNSDKLCAKSFALRFHSQFRTFEEVPKSQYYGVGLEIEEFRIIGFYLYHVTSIRSSISMGASGLLTASLNIDYDRGSSSYYC